MELEIALSLLRQTQIANMQVGHDPVLGDILKSLEELARRNVKEQRTASDWMNAHMDQLFSIE
jgi:hypothetical protein